MENLEAIQMLVNATYSDEWQGNEKLQEAQNMSIEALEKQDKVIELITKLSIYAEQHKVLSATDVFDWLEDIYPNWNEVE